jgi:hypothetical protein
MSRKEKLIKRFMSLLTDFQYSELVKLLSYYDFYEISKGRTSGSRVKFMDKAGRIILLHRPHPDGRMKLYQLRQIKELLMT